MRTGVLVAIAGCLIGLGLLLGLLPGSAQGANEQFSCGSPWSMDAKAISDQEYLARLGNSLSGPDLWTGNYRQRCEDALQARGVFAWITISLGAVALIAALATWQPKKTEDSTAQTGE